MLRIPAMSLADWPCIFCMSDMFLALQFVMEIISAFPASQRQKQSSTLPTCSPAFFHCEGTIRFKCIRTWNKTLLRSKHCLSSYLNAFRRSMKRCYDFTFFFYLHLKFTLKKAKVGDIPVSQHLRHVGASSLAAQLARSPH